MASGSQEDAALTSKSLDVVFLGHSDGTVVAWGVSKPHIGDVFGKGTVWVPLRSLGCGSAPITTISTDHIRLMAAGDESGRVVVWETFDSESGDSGLTGSSCGKYPSFDSSTGDNIVITGSRRGSDASDTESFASAASTVYVPTNFHPNDLRETFSGTVDGAVTCIELIGEAITLFVGTDAGNIYCARDWGSGELNILQIPPQAKVNASGPIVHLMYSSFWYGSSAVPAIYGFYGSGHVLVWHIFTNELIAYAAGASEMYVDANESLDILYGHVMDGDMKPLDRPDPFYKPPSPTGSPNSSPSAMPPPGSVEDVPPTPPPVTSPDSSATKKSFLSRMNSSSKNSTPEPSGGKLFGNKTQATAAPTEGPRWVVVVGCHAMILYDLGKFCVRSASGSYSNDVAGVANSKFLSEEKIITAESTIFVEEAARAYTDPVACISCVSSDGVMTIIALKSMQVMTESIEIFLLKGVERRPVSVSDGVMLPNGDCYLLNNECIVYCLSYSSTNYVHNHAVPVRAGCHHVTPPKEWQFRTGREDKVVAAKKAVQKRRASMISLSAAPTDLDKIFAKTRTDWNREELFGIQADEEACRKRAGSVQSVPQTALRSAATTKAALAEVQQSFEERGERLKQINERMEHFREAAAEYKKNSAEQRERMKAKSARWGVF